MPRVSGRPNTYRYWTAAECDILRARYEKARRERLMSLLPGRSWSRIKQKGRELGLHRPRSCDAARYWLGTSVLEKLRVLYPSAPWDVLLAAFPGRSKCGIGNAARRLGLARNMLVAMGGRNKVREPVIVALVMRRGELGLSQEVLARKLGLSRSYFAECERGQANYSRDTLRRWCVVLGMEIAVRVRVTAMQRQAAADMAAYERRMAA